MNNSLKKSRADWLKDPATRHPLNRPRSTWSPADEAWMEDEAQKEAERISKSVTSKGTDADNTAELHRKVMAELYKRTPQSQSSFSGGEDLFQHRSLDDEENDFDRRIAEARLNQQQLNQANRY